MRTIRGAGGFFNKPRGLMASTAEFSLGNVAAIACAACNMFPLITVPGGGSQEKNLIFNLIKCNFRSLIFHW